MNDKQLNDDKLIQEYKEINRNYRHIEKLRFSLFCFYLLVLYALVQFSFHNSRVKLVGIIITIVFLGFDSYFQVVIRHLKKMAIRLEKLLEFNQFKSRRIPQVFWLNYLTSIFYLILLLFIVSR